DRARVRQHEVQPQDRPLRAPRKIRCALRVAINHCHPQPPEAPQAPNSRRGGLRRDLRRPATPKSRRHNHQYAAAAHASRPICATATTTSSRPSRPPTLRSLSPPSSSLSAWVPINKSTVLGLAGPRQAPDCVLAYHQEQARAADLSEAAIARTPAEAKGSAALGPRAR